MDEMPATPLRTKEKLIASLKNFNEFLRPYLPVINFSILAIFTINLMIGSSDDSKGWIAAINSDIDDLRSEIETLQDQTNEHESEISDHESEISSIKSDVSDLETRVGY